MADKVLKLNETRNAFIAGVLHASTTPVKASEILSKLGVSDLDRSIAVTFLEVTLEEIKANKVVEKKTWSRKPKSKKVESPETAKVEPADSDDEEEDDDKEIYGGVEND